MDQEKSGQINFIISRLGRLLKKEYLEENDRKTLQDIRYFLTREMLPAKAKPKQNEAISSADRAWLKMVEALFLKHYKETQFKREWVAYEINLSERQFTRRLKQLAGLTPNQYLREIRLQTAKDLLFSGKCKTIKEVSYAVGYIDSPYFSRLFLERFGILPSEYLK